MWYCSWKEGLSPDTFWPQRSSFDIYNHSEGYFAVSVREDEQKHYVVPVSYLNKPVLQELLRMAEEEFRYEHLMGGLTIPYREDILIDLTSRF